MNICFATGNPHKLQEINEISHGSGIKFVLPPNGFNPVEIGKTFEDNSLIKAKEAARLSGMMSLADDSGLCIDALDGAPGIYSARYAGTQTEKIQKILDELKGQNNRNAKFVCVMSLVDKNGNIVKVCRGECHGKISEKPTGSNGFGYDPIFYVEDTGITMAEMSETVKNEFSHRGRALREILKFIKTL